MTIYIKRLLRISISLLYFSMSVQAQEVQITIKAPRKVAVGQSFRLSYMTNTQEGQFQAIKFTNFKILSGPNSSRSSRVQIINGKMEQSVEVSYNYVLQAEREGKFSIPSGTLNINGKAFSSDSGQIDVIARQAGGQANSNNSNPAPQATLGTEDLFLKMLISKREVIKGEPIIATLKLYTRVSLANLGSFKSPSFNGFWAEALRKEEGLQFQRETINGQMYNAAIIQQHVLIPERSGTLNIEPAELTAIAQVQVRNSRRRSRSLFDQFFGSAQNVEKILRSAALELNVKPLPPGAPPSFDGAVGTLQLTGDLEPRETKTNEAISFKLNYSGMGNLKLIGAPKLQFPPDFEVYDPKIRNNYSASTKGFSGNKSFEYLLIPRHAGIFEIPKLEFTFFDLNAKAYETLAVGPFTVNVEKGEGGATTEGIDLGMIKEDVRQLDTDIRYIRTGAIPLRQKDRPFFGSLSFYLAYLIALGLFAVALAFLRRQRKQREDVVGMKHKKAAKVAQGHLKKAKQFMDKGEQGAFYKELLDTYWGYLSDKLNVPQGGLHKEKVESLLADRGVGESLIKSTIAILNRCEFAQFAPSGARADLTSVYQESISLINDLETALKK